ncbi:MAG TPA: hypothetical protein P5080_00215 [Candidatus Paceibacterota bacterium]|nr:hypothetical protein [Candidatus Pacearchaeota archaeon]HRZ50398.1 hypothetical protein [Candidatus Paceibacterota bacterium]HSA36119.1 hypothetical protein [Candidatus Paceibacterota bacterium]
MTITKKQTIMALSAVLALSAAGIGSAYAATETAEKTNPINRLATAIASKFNLDAQEVQSVFDEQKTRMAAQRVKNFEDRLNNAVAAGKLTQAQADGIRAKQSDMEKLRTEMRGKTKEEIRTAVKAQMADLKQWAEDNNIPKGYMMIGGRGMGGRPGPGMKGFGDPDCPCKNTGAAEVPD